MVMLKKKTLFAHALVSALYCSGAYGMDANRYPLHDAVRDGHINIVQAPN